MKKRLFLDFDETLFHHLGYIKWVDALLVKQGVESGHFFNTLWDYHHSQGENLNLYDHETHTFKALGKEWSFMSGEFEKALQEREGDFCYDDAHTLIEQAIEKGYDVRVLTYGNGEYQRYKIRTCKALSRHNIPVHVVTGPKREFLEKYFDDAMGGTLIDDKQPLRLPQSWKHIWINRKAIKPQALDIGVREVTTLDQVTL